MRNKHMVFFLALLTLLFTSYALAAQDIGLPDSPLSRDIIKAGELLEANDVKGAQQILEKSIAANQTSDKETMATATQLLGMCYEQQNDRKRAERVYKAVLKQYPGTKGAIRAQFRLDTIAGKHTKPEGQAISPEQLEREFRGEKDAKKAADIASAIIWQHGNRESIHVARKIYDQYVSRFGYIKETQEVLFALASVNESAGLFPDSLKLMDELFRRFPSAETNPRYLIKYGYGMNLTGSSKAAISVFDRALRQDPDKFLRAKALLGKGFAYRNLRQPREANVALAEAKKLSQEIGDSMNIENIAQLEEEVRKMSDDHSDSSSDNVAGKPVWIKLLSLVALALVGVVVVVRIIRLNRPMSR